MMSFNQCTNKGLKISDCCNWPIVLQSAVTHLPGLSCSITTPCAPATSLHVTTQVCKFLLCHLPPSPVPTASCSPHDPCFHLNVYVPTLLSSLISSKSQNHQFEIFSMTVSPHYIDTEGVLEVTTPLASESEASSPLPVNTSPPHLNFRKWLTALSSLGTWWYPYSYWTIWGQHWSNQLLLCLQFTGNIEGICMIDPLLIIPAFPPLPIEDTEELHKNLSLELDQGNIDAVVCVLPCPILCSSKAIWSFVIVYVWSAQGNVILRLVCHSLFHFIFY